jgi:hypothetical protein
MYCQLALVLVQAGQVTTRPSYFPQFATRRKRRLLAASGVERCGAQRRPWSSPSRAFRSRADDRARQDEVNVRTVATGAMPAALAVKALAAVRPQPRQDVLEIGRGSRGGPSVAGSSGPRQGASSARPKRPLRISKRRSAMSSCGTRSQVRCSAGPRARAASREPVSAPSAAPVATWRETITSGA